MKTNRLFWQFIKPSVWLKGLFTISISILCILVACKDDTISPDLPIVLVGEVTDINTDGATFHARIINPGVASITEVGFVWDTVHTPGLNSSRKVVTYEEGTTAFHAQVVADHQAGKEYSVKAYLKNGEQIFFGNTVKFTSMGSMQPVINSFSPSYGTQGTEVLIKGENFSQVLSHISVNFGTFKAIVLASTDTTIYVKLPNSINISDFVKVVVSVSGNTGSSEESFRFIGPVIESISSPSGSCGDVLVLKGYGFITGGKPEVIFPYNEQNINGYSGVLKNYNDSLIEVYVPALHENFNNIIILKTGRYNTKSSEKFQYHPARIDSVSELSILGGDSLKIYGDSFKDIITVTIKQAEYPHFLYYLQIIEYTRNRIIVKIPEVVGEYTLELRTECGYFSFLPKLEIITPWEEMEPTPFGARYGAFSVVHDDHVYIGLGQNCNTTEFYNDFWKYNLETKQWTKLSDFPGLARSHAAATKINGKILVGTGYSPYAYETNSLTNDFWLFDPDTEQWSSRNPLPNLGRWHALLFTINGKVFCGLGHSDFSIINRDLYEYSYDKDEWTPAGFFPIDLIPPTQSVYFTSNEKGYFLYDNRYDPDDISILYEFDDISHSWSQIIEVDYGIQYAFSNNDDVVTINSNGEILLFSSVDLSKTVNLPNIFSLGYREYYIGFIYQSRLYIGTGNMNGCRNDMIYLDLNDYR
jgi:hypothetical protein